MRLGDYLANYSFEMVAGSTEKPNSAFKKKEAIQAAQAVGQFAKAAPGATMKIMLRLFQKAFSDIVVHQEDWDLLDKEITATLQKGISTQGAPPGAGDATAGAAGGQPQAQPGAGGVDQFLASVPPEVKQRAAQMIQQGVPPEQVMQTLKQSAQSSQQPASNPQRRRNNRGSKKR
jgi:hypothetical protein